MNKSTETIQASSPVLFRLLSDLGRVCEFPPDIPFQAAQARDKKFNATIGQITDGHGSPITLPQMAASLAAVGRSDFDKSFLYSPVAGIDELRSSWRGWQRSGQPDEKLTTLPIATVGLTHGLSLVADLFAGSGRPVAVAAPFWGNYRQTFSLRTGAQILTAPAYRSGACNTSAISEALRDVPDGEPALAILNFPSNPGGYMPTMSEREEIRGSLVEIADKRPLMVVCDDAYQGLVYEDDIPRQSMFWDLNGIHEQLLPVKIDGATKELAFFGGRVGFLTFALPSESAIAEAVESKVKCLLRATVGSPVSTTQVVALQALRSSSLGTEVEKVRLTLAGRYRQVRESLENVDATLATTLPFNSGCFALVELAPDLEVSAESIRQRLLDEFDTGLISIAPNFLRIAFCSIDSEAIPAVVDRLQAALAEVAGIKI